MRPECIIAQRVSGAVSAESVVDLAHLPQVSRGVKRLDAPRAIEVSHPLERQVEPPERQGFEGGSTRVHVWNASEQHRQVVARGAGAHMRKRQEATDIALAA